MWLFAAFVAIPLIEIALFIQVGGVIGLWATLGIVVVTALLGSFLVRQQGLREMNRLRASFSTLSDPGEPLANGAMILFAGALLLTPGFFTDTVGFLLLIPPVRTAAFRWIKSRVTVASFAMGDRAPHGAAHPGSGRDTIIDGDYEEVPPDSRTTHQPSGWTRH